MADPADMSTPAERRRLKVRASILDAADKVFARDGVEGLSIRRLAAKIDYSPAAIYKYFPSKEDLLDELKEAFFGRILSKVDRVQSAAVPFSERARLCIREYVLTALEKPNHYAAAFSAAETSVPPKGQSWEDFAASQKGQAFLFLLDMVREGQANGVFRQDMQALLAAKSVWSASHGLAMLMIHMPLFPALLPDHVDTGRESFLAFHADLVIRGLEAGATQEQETHDNGHG